MQHHLISRLSMLGFLELKFKFRGVQPIAQYNWIYYRGVKMYCKRFSTYSHVDSRPFWWHNFQNKYSFLSLSQFLLGIPLIDILGKLLSPSGPVYLLSPFPHLALGYTVLAAWYEFSILLSWGEVRKFGTRVVLRHFNLIWIWFVIRYTTSCNIIYLYDLSKYCYLKINWRFYLQTNISSLLAIDQSINEFSTVQQRHLQCSLPLIPYIKPKKHTDYSVNQYNILVFHTNLKQFISILNLFLYQVKDWHILISAVDFDVSQKSKETKAVSIWYADDNFKDYDQLPPHKVHTVT